MQLKVGETKKLVLADAGTAVGTLTFQSLNPTMATVDATGKVTGVANGNTMIVIKNTADGTSWNQDIIVVPVSGVVPSHSYAASLNPLSVFDIDTFATDTRASYTRNYANGSFDTNVTIASNKLTAVSNTFGAWVKTETGNVVSVQADVSNGGIGSNNINAIGVQMYAGGNVNLTFGVQGDGSSIRIGQTGDTNGFTNSIFYGAPPAGLTFNAGAANTLKMVLDYSTGNVLCYVNGGLAYTVTDAQIKAQFGQGIATYNPKAAGMFLYASNGPSGIFSNFSIEHY